MPNSVFGHELEMALPISHPPYLFSQDPSQYYPSGSFLFFPSGGSLRGFSTKLLSLCVEFQSHIQPILDLSILTVRDDINKSPGASLCHTLHLIHPSQAQMFSWTLSCQTLAIYVVFPKRETTLNSDTKRVAKLLFCMPAFLAFWRTNRGLTQYYILAHYSTSLIRECQWFNTFTSNTSFYKPF